MTSVATAAGCAVAHAQHIWQGALHFVSAKGKRQSIPHGQQGYVGDDGFWMGWCVREV